MPICPILSKTLDSLKPGQAVINFADPSLPFLITCLKETLADKQEQFRKINQAGNGVGLAANQIAFPPMEDSSIDASVKAPDWNSYNVYVVSVLPERAAREGCVAMPPTAYINAKIIASAGEEALPSEACLSVAGIAGINVKRFKHITVEYYDEQGNRREERFSGFLARIHQHEIDHNEGKEYLNHLHFSQDELTRILAWCDNEAAHIADYPIVPDKLKCTTNIPDVDALRTFAQETLTLLHRPRI